ncbi:hypothetical protein ACQPWY_25625 [Pseudonocardia xinjiangensis]|uniref:hypothetical protein n=1 Tax=Pseudonocardia xinjiangensis TaxID=75289 RepID=UPI003D8B6015
MVRVGSGRRPAAERGFHPLLRRYLGRSRRGGGEARATRRSSAPDGGLALFRLLSSARLTPAQAVALGTDVLARLEEQRGAGLGPSRIRLGLDTVLIGADGAGFLADDGPGREPVPDGSRTDLDAAARLLGDLAAASSRPGAASGDPATAPLTALGRAATEARVPGAGIGDVVSILREADAPGGAEARAELARLVAAVSGGDFAPPVPPRVPPLPATPRPLRPQGRPRSIARTVVARSWKWVLSLVVLVAAIMIEISFLRDGITRNIEAVLEAGRSGTPASTSAAALPPVVPVEPPAAGPVTGVDLRAVNRCAPNAACGVRLQVVVAPRAEPQTVTWAFQVVDRCTDARSTVPGGTVTVPAEGDRADAVVTVTLPKGDALAVLAVTQQPAIAASAPLLVPADADCGSPVAEPSR